MTTEQKIAELQSQIAKLQREVDALRIYGKPLLRAIPEGEEPLFDKDENILFRVPEPDERWVDPDGNVRTDYIKPYSHGPRIILAPKPKYPDYRLVLDAVRRPKNGDIGIGKTGLPYTVLMDAFHPSPIPCYRIEEIKP